MKNLDVLLAQLNNIYEMYIDMLSGNGGNPLSEEDFKSYIINEGVKYSSDGTLLTSGEFPKAGYNRLVTGIKGDSSLVVKIAKNNVGLDDNFRAVKVSDIAANNRLLENKIALANYIITDNYNSYQNIGNSAIIQEKLRVLDISIQNEMTKILTGNSTLWESYKDMIRVLERAFIIADVNILDTPYNFGKDVKGNLKLLDLGQLVPIPAGNSPICPVCGGPLEYYIPENDVELGRWVQHKEDGYVCSTAGCKHSVVGSDGIRKNSVDILLVDAASIASMFFETFYR